MKAYKLVRKEKDGTLYPLFIDRHRPYIFGEEREAEYIPTKGFAPRCGFHCCFTTHAPHLKRKLANGEERVWMECDIHDYTTYDRPESQGGAWLLAKNLTAIRELSEEEVHALKKYYANKEGENHG